MTKYKISPAKNVKDSVGYIIDALHEIRTNPSHDYPKEEVERLENIEREFAESVKDIKAPMWKLPSSDELRISITKFNFDLFERLTRLTERGWYISPDILENLPVDEMIELTKYQNLDTLEKRIKEPSNSTISSILIKCKKQFPDRNELWDEMKLLFDSELYFGLVTLAYSQADGICNDTWNQSFYQMSRTEGKLKLKDVIGNKYDGFFDATIQQLGIPSNELTVKTRNNEAFDDEKFVRKTYNRHKVLHGQSIHFGNKINAIRSLYLLDYLRFLAEHFKQRN